MPDKLVNTESNIQDGPRVFPHHCHVCQEPARVWVAYCVKDAAKYLNMDESEKLLMKEIEGQGELWPTK